MSINVGQLFVRHDNLALITRVATEYVRYWQKEVFSRLSQLEKEEQAAEHFLTRRSRRMTVLPPRDGWAMIVEHVRFLADGDLARHLSESLDCRVVWAEIQGGALGWACFEFEGGKLASGKLEPRAGREPRLVAAANEAKAINLSEAESPEMPLYPADPEARAWEHLCGLGLPREYIFVYPGDIVRLSSGGEVEVGFLTLKDSHYGGRLTATVGPARMISRPEGMPYRPDLVARQDGAPVAIHEVRLLHGRPGQEALDRVFAAELNWRRRAFSVMSSTLEGRVPEVLFRYKDPADPDRDLDKPIEERRQACRSPFITLTSGAGVLARKGFAARAAEVINGQKSEMEAEPDESGNLTVKVGKGAAALNLSKAYRRYLAEPPALEAAALDALSDFEARAALLGELGPSHRAKLSLLLRPAGSVPPDAVSAPLGESFAAVLAVERDDGLVEVPRRGLEALGLDEGAALEAARSALAAAAAGIEPSPGVGAFGRLEGKPSLPASSLLAWPGLAAKLGEDVVMAAPSRDVLLYAAGSAAEDAGLLAAVMEEYDTAAEPLSGRLFRLTDSGPAAV